MFKVERIDHVHEYVSDPLAAAAWYLRVLGLYVIDSLSSFTGDGGPLTISSDNGNTADVSGHGSSWPVYFCDEDRNPIEVTTYDYAVTSNGLRLT